MAVFLQMHKDGVKGLLILSHREKNIFDSLNRVAPNVIDEIMIKYVIVVHIGWVLEHISDSSYITNFFCVDGNLQNRDNVESKIIPISSREFIPTMFEYSNEDKEIDLAIVTNAAKHKKPSKIIDISKEMLRSVRPFKTFFMVTFPSKVIKSKFDMNIEKRFWNIIPSEKRNYFSFLSVKAQASLYPLPRWFIAKIYKSSKYYLHTCEKEGESRAIGEALLAKAVVLVPSNLEGGARSLAEKNQNCYFYSSLEEASDIILNERYQYTEPGFKVDMDVAKSKLYDFYSQNSLGDRESFDEMLVKYDLSMALPGHIYPQYEADKSKGHTTADVDSFSKLHNFLAYLDIDVELSFSQSLKLRFSFMCKLILLQLKSRLQPLKVYIYDKL